MAIIYRLDVHTTLTKDSFEELSKHMIHTFITLNPETDREEIITIQWFPLEDNTFATSSYYDDKYVCLATKQMLQKWVGTKGIPPLKFSLLKEIGSSNTQ
jgi:hypothetical protein